MQDFLQATKIHRVGLPEFHNERLFSLQCADDQKRPDLRTGYSKPGLFVISKIDILAKVKTAYSIEQHEKQVFHEFDRVGTGFEIFKIHPDADKDFNLIATDAEMKYCQDNAAQIKKVRLRNLQKEEYLCHSNVIETDI